VEVANNGTLFLDEIWDMPLSLQAKLLMVIEIRSFFRLGGIHEQKVDVSILAATNKDLMNEIRKGSFRQDLYYRVAALTLREDIPVLIDYFTKNNN
jgi:transcriptional regulator with PAS, ATPase and Fis domain